MAGADLPEADPRGAGPGSGSQGASVRPPIAKPAADVEIRYAGDVFVAEPLSPAGEAWFDRIVPHRRSGVVRVAMRHLDDVLSRIRQARLELQVAWDLRASQLVADLPSASDRMRREGKGHHQQHRSRVLSRHGAPLAVPGQNLRVHRSPHMARRKGERVRF
jgi:hypothetical protein